MSKQLKPSFIKASKCKVFLSIYSEIDFFNFSIATGDDAQIAPPIGFDLSQDVSPTAADRRKSG